MGVAKLEAGGNGLAGTTAGIPFPAPKDGAEAIWNSLQRYKGDTYAMTWNQAAVTRDGAYTLVRFEYEYDFSYGNISKNESQREPNKLVNFLQIVTAPARLAGQVLLIHETMNQVKQPRSAWIYNPGQRRVLSGPNVAYDNPGTAADGLRTSDDFGMYNGAIDRYEWKLVGKQEMYIPYNSYKLSGNSLKYADILKPGHINPEHARYELHRVWVVEANLKPGASHIYKRRVFYIDEDSWAVVVTDKYDARDQLWRVSNSTRSISTMSRCCTARSRYITTCNPDVISPWVCATRNPRYIGRSAARPRTIRRPICVISERADSGPATLEPGMSIQPDATQEMASGEMARPSAADNRTAMLPDACHVAVVAASHGGGRRCTGLARTGCPSVAAGCGAHGFPAGGRGRARADFFRPTRVKPGKRPRPRARRRLPRFTFMMTCTAGRLAMTPSSCAPRTVV